MVAPGALRDKAEGPVGAFLEATSVFFSPKDASKVDIFSTACSVESPRLTPPFGLSALLEVLMACVVPVMSSPSIRLIVNASLSSIGLEPVLLGLGKGCEPVMNILSDLGV